MATMEENFELEWRAIMESREARLQRLVSSGILQPLDKRMLHRSSDDLIVGTNLEHVELQRGDVRFSAPTSRSNLVRDIKS